MAPILKWKDWLASVVASDSDWAGVTAARDLNHLDNLTTKSPSDNVMEVAATNGRAAFLVAEADRQVRFVHNLRVVKDDNEFKIVGVSGMGSTSTFRMVPREAMEDSFNKRNRTFKIPTADQLNVVDNAVDFKGLRGDGGSGTDLDSAANKTGFLWVHPKLWKVMGARPVNAEELAMKVNGLFPVSSDEVDGMADMVQLVPCTPRYIGLAVVRHFVRYRTKNVPIRTLI